MVYFRYLSHTFSYCLIQDIHYLAQSVGNHDVADASKERAMQIHYRETNEGDYLQSVHTIQIQNQFTVS